LGILGIKVADNYYMNNYEMSLIMHIVTLCEREVTDVVRKGLSFLMCVEASIM